MRITIASGPVIIERGRVLLDKHGHDKFWKFPGGRMKRGESAEQACRKRVKEELGITVEIIRPLKPMVLWHFDEVIVLLHYLSKRKGKIKKGKHVRKYAWLDIKKLPRDIGPNIKPVLASLKQY